jgi:hypothetical protein
MEAPVKIFIPISFIVTSTLLAACSGSGAIQKPESRRLVRR